MDKELLRTLGLTGKEIVVYGAVLKRRRVTPAELSTSTRLNRTTVYAVAKSLIGKGYLAEDLAGRKRTLVAVPSEELRKLFRREERELKEKEKSIERLIAELSLVQAGAEYPVPKIRFVEYADVEDYLHDRFPAWIKSMKESSGGEWWGFQDHSFVERFKEWIDWSWKHTPPEIELKLLSNLSDIERRLAGKYAKRHIKFWEKGGNFTATTWIMGEYMVLLQTNAKPFYLIEIHDALLSHNQREVFKGLWETL